MVAIARCEAQGGVPRSPPQPTGPRGGLELCPAGLAHWTAVQPPNPHQCGTGLGWWHPTTKAPPGARYSRSAICDRRERLPAVEGPSAVGRSVANVRELPSVVGWVVGPWAIGQRLPCAAKWMCDMTPTHPRQVRAVATPPWALLSRWGGLGRVGWAHRAPCGLNSRMLCGLISEPPVGVVQVRVW